MPSLLLLVLFASSLFLETVVSVPQDNNPGTAELISAASSLGGPQNTVTSTCGGCFVVAEVQAIVWYSQIFEYNAATAFVNVGVGNTTGRSTSTLIVENTNEFTFRAGETGTDSNLVLTPVTYDSTVKVQGAVLSYPTAYNVFTAYAINSEMPIPGGGCSTIYSSTKTLATGYSEKIEDSSGVVTLDAAGEQEFITNVLRLDCRGQGVNMASPLALVPITSVTVVTTQFQPTVSRAYQSRLSLAPTSTPYTSAKPGITTLTSVISTRTASLNATELAETAGSSVTSASEAGSESGSESGFEPTTTTYPLATAPVIIFGSLTITPPRNPVALSLYQTTSIGSGSTGVVVIVPTGTGSNAGNYTAIVPFLSKAGSWRRGHFSTSLWAATLSGLGLMMIWL